MTRQEVAAYLGVSVATVRRMEKISLHPVRDERGVWRFDRRKVEAAEMLRVRRKGPDRREGDVAARVFLMFSERRSLREIVATLRVPPGVVRALYTEWLTDLSTGEHVRRMKELDADAAARERDFAKLLGAT